MPVEIKICGLSTAETMHAALDAGADLVGLVFFPKSPRNVSLANAAALAALAHNRAKVVALTVDADDAALSAIVAAATPDLLQLHGSETPARCAAIRNRFGIPVMKAIGVAEAADLKVIDVYRPAIDRILLDAKPPKGADLPGGNGAVFDWALIENLGATVPFMLSGGLAASNIAEAIRRTAASAVDVSSGVETAPGIKSPALIRAFIAAARAV